MRKILFNLLCNSITGWIISRIFSNRIPNIRYLSDFFRYNTANSSVSNKIKAMIFFGFYEAAETRLIRKYIPNHLPVVEIGASLGVISNLILAKIDSRVDLIAIEANTILLPNLRDNTITYTNKLIINKAITYDQTEDVLFQISSNNTEGSLAAFANCDLTNFISVPTIILRDIVSVPFVLISDIEGAEIEFLLNDAEAMRLCSHLFIELHQTTYKEQHYSVSDINNLILSKYDFQLIDRDGHVFYYSR